MFFLARPLHSPNLRCGSGPTLRHRSCGVRLLPFPAGPVRSSRPLDVQVSRFSCMQFLSVLGATTTRWGRPTAHTSTAGRIALPPLLTASASLRIHLRGFARQQVEDVLNCIVGFVVGDLTGGLEGSFGHTILLTHALLRLITEILWLRACSLRPIPGIRGSASPRLASVIGHNQCPSRTSGRNIRCVWDGQYRHSWTTMRSKQRYTKTWKRSKMTGTQAASLG